MNRLLHILTHKRPAGSITEQQLLADLFSNYETTTREGNTIISVGDSTTLFSCHTDTVHSNHGIQRVFYDEEFATISLEIDQPESSCLGADDGAGMWLLLEMIDAGVPGTYIFHHSEEQGGIGSAALSKDTEYLRQFNRAIAFDRKGTEDIIEAQRGGECCSKEFVSALSAQFAEQNLPYRGARGVFTDTANYIHIIPECTNLSVGYYSEHTTGEWLDVEHLMQLREACIQLDWESLPTARNPHEQPPSNLFDMYAPSTLRSDLAYWGSRCRITTEKDAAALSLEDLIDECEVFPIEAAELVWGFLHPAEQEITE